jgi:hypothetical protein
MKTGLRLLALFVALALLWLSRAPLAGVQASNAAGGGHGDNSESMPVQVQETIRKTFTAGAALKLLDVDNVYGSIEVTGGQADQVQLVVNKTIRAESSERMEAAKKEVTLDITDQPDLLKLYVKPARPVEAVCERPVPLQLQL